MEAFLDPKIVDNFVSAYGPGIGLLLVYLVRDWTRDRHFKGLREEEERKYTCGFSDERDRNISEIRDMTRDIKAIAEEIKKNTV